jgi:hypothetical protein
LFQNLFNHHLAQNQYSDANQVINKSFAAIKKFLNSTKLSPIATGGYCQILSSNCLIL